MLWGITDGTFGPAFIGDCMVGLRDTIKRERFVFTWFGWRGNVSHESLDMFASSRWTCRGTLAVLSFEAATQERFSFVTMNKIRNIV